MSRIVRTLLFWIVILSACSPSRPSTEAFPSNPATDTSVSIISSVSATELPTAGFLPTPTTEVLPPPKLIATLATPHIDQGPEGANTVPPSYPQDCGYQWAYEDLPKLSSDFQQSIQGLQPEAQTHVFAFGENCVHTDGSTNFIPMETDFNITLQVNDLSNESDLGEWIVKVMQAIENIPPDQIVGPRPGRVSINFQSNTEQTGVNFYIDQYHALTAGLTNAEIYQTLKNPQ